MTEYGITASQTVGPFLKIGLVRDGQEYVVPKNTNAESTSLISQLTESLGPAKSKVAPRDIPGYTNSKKILNESY